MSIPTSTAQPISAALPAPAPRRNITVRHRRRERWGLGFVSPFFVLFACFTLAPLAYAIYTSFFRDQLIGGQSFVGFANFTFLFKRETFWMVVRQSCVFAITAVVGALRRRAFALESDFGQRARRRDAHN